MSVITGTTVGTIVFMCLCTQASMCNRHDDVLERLNTLIGNITAHVEDIHAKMNNISKRDAHNEHVYLDYILSHAPNYTRAPGRQIARIDLRPSNTASAFVKCDNYQLVKPGAPSDYILDFSCSGGNVQNRHNTGSVACFCNEAKGSGHDNRFWSLAHHHKQCDLTIGPSPDADLHTSFARWTITPKHTPFTTAAKYLEMPRDPRFREEVPVVFIQRNCKTTSKREGFVRELAKHVPVHAVDNCLHNHDIDGLKPRDGAHPNRDTKLNVLRNYMFTVALENADTCGYVTEKMYDAIAAGSVPIVAGLPCNEHFLPHEDSVIRIRDFGKDPVRVAAHIKRLTEDHSEYMRYHNWRYNSGFDKQWVDTVLFNDFTSIMCRLAYTLNSTAAIH